MKHSPPALAMIGFVKAWRAVISPLYGNVCRYHPSCSAYGLESLEVHGAVKGSWLTIWRICRCNPWSPGGYDPVPGTPAAKAWELEQAGAERHQLSSATSTIPVHQQNPATATRGNS